jgi:proliferating cell nuclear antigen
MIESPKAGQVKRTVDAIASFISEGNFRFTDKGISLRAVDPSQIVLVDCFIEKSAFSQYQIEPTLVGVDIVELARMLARSLPNDKLFLDVSDAEMELKLEGDFTRSFSLPLIDVSDGEKEIKIPENKFDARIEINARLLKEALKDAHIFGSSVTLKVKNKQFHIEAKGSQGTLRTVSKEGKLISVKHGVDVTSKYSLNYLSNVIKEADNDSIITLELKSDAPLRVSYEIGKTKLQYYLAHMIL